MEQIGSQEEELEEQNRVIVQLVKEKETETRKTNYLEQTSEDLRDEIKSSCERIKHLEDLAAQHEREKHLSTSSVSSLADEIATVNLDTSEREELKNKLKESEDELELTRREVSQLQEIIYKNETLSRKRLLKLQLIEKMSRKGIKTFLHFKLN